MVVGWGRIFLALALAFGLIAPAEAETVKIALTKLLSYPSVPIAIDRGYFEAEGLDAQMVFFDSAEPMVVALTAGDVDFGVSGLSAAFYTLAAQVSASSPPPRAQNSD